MTTGLAGLLEVMDLPATTSVRSLAIKGTNIFAGLNGEGVSYPKTMVQVGMLLAFLILMLIV